LVIAATSDNEANERIYNAAVKLNIFVNVVDDPKSAHLYFRQLLKKMIWLLVFQPSGSFPNAF
jgi:precorrin-2 dehydrogenase/sirohydrochlorin ferrochelatase